MRRALRRQVPWATLLPQSHMRPGSRSCDLDGMAWHRPAVPVSQLANIHLAPTAAALGRRDHRLNQRPFGIRQVTRISQTTPLSSAAMFRFPHLGTPQSTIRVPHNKSQMIHPTQQLSGSALRARHCSPPRTSLSAPGMPRGYPSSPRAPKLYSRAGYRCARLIPPSLTSGLQHTAGPYR